MTTQVHSRSNVGFEGETGLWQLPRKVAYENWMCKSPNCKGKKLKEQLPWFLNIFGRKVRTSCCSYLGTHSSTASKVNVSEEKTDLTIKVLSPRTRIKVTRVRSHFTLCVVLPLYIFFPLYCTWCQFLQHIHLVSVFYNAAFKHVIICNIFSLAI